MPIIQNFDALVYPELVEGAENDLRRDALAVAEAGYAAINVDSALRRTLSIKDDSLAILSRRNLDMDTGAWGTVATYPLAGRHVFFIGVGKCAFAAAPAIEEIFGDRLAGGIALDVGAPPRGLKKIETIVGTHPLPSEANAQATDRILNLLSERTENDLVVTLISGGGSTLLCAPAAPLTPAGERAIFTELTAQGAAIQELNTVRKHLSRARGGGLARAAFPAEVVALIVSDVPGDDLAFVSSGPTVRDTTTVVDAQAILAHYGVTPPPEGALIETPKEEKYFARVTNVLLLASRDALTAMEREAQERGYAAEIANTHFTGEARDIGRSIVEKLHAAAPHTALLFAGESTVTLGAHLSDTPCQTMSDTECRTNHAMGGRNQEMALAALGDISPGELILPFASDGHDNTDHAGAIADARTRAHAEAHDISLAEHLAAHRSYDFFKTTGDALLTGYTGSNVSDLIIALKRY